ncbi:hypothetical protein AVL59_28440 [Streptomyces griseochromogenes]|uniref:CHAT domain-containing protein n=1 Tax=Streptomyces griseochromogenes TaxID=68214 RepID=A0A1B1B2H8_9ACTN|nr:hypothetical protein AVL59_28440 [Streptomyces griseochromogenes]
MDECLVAAISVMDGNPDLAYHWWRLVVAMTEAKWGRDRWSPWWDAADRFVEITRRTLLPRPWGSRLRQALHTADLQAEILERTLTEFARHNGPHSGRRSRATASERAELTETRLSAAWLLAGPYCGKLDPDDVPGSFDRWTDPFRLRITRVLAVRTLGESGTDEMDESMWNPDHDRSMPEPQAALEEALALLDSALREAPQALRGRCQLKRLQVLSLLARVDSEREDAYWEAASEAVGEVWHTVNRAGLLDEFFRAVGSVVRRLGVSEPFRLKALLPVPLSRLRREAHGTRLLGLLADVVLFIEDRGDLREIWATVHAVVGENQYLDVAPWVCRNLAHHLPGNHLRCPRTPVGIAELTARVEEMCRHKGASSGDRAATLVHAALHARTEDVGEVVTLLDMIFKVDRKFRDTYAWLLDCLLATYRQRYVAWLRDQGRHLQALVECALAAEGALRQAARHLSPGYVADVANQALASADLAARDHDRPDFDLTFVVMLLLRAVEPVVGALAGPQDGRSDLVRDLGQEVARLVTRTESPSLIAAQHLLFKGYGFRLLVQQPGPRPLTPSVQHLHEMIAAREALDGPYVPDRLGLFDDGAWAPAETSGLFYINSRDIAPGTDAEASCGNLRKVADRFISIHMLHGPHRPAFEEATRPDLFEIAELGDNGLDDGTVLLSLFLADHLDLTAFRRARGAPLVSCHVTTGEVTGNVVELPVHPGLTRAHDHALNVTHAWSWMVLPVAEVREEVNVDPGGSPVTLRGAEVLERHFRLSGTTKDDLRRWRAEGRKHLCFWPHGPLHYLPFHLLHVDGRPLADDWVVTTVAATPHCSARGTDTAASRTHRLLIAGSATGGVMYGLPEQPQIRRHVHNLSARIPGARALEDGMTTPRALMAALQGIDYLHIAAHGSHDVEAPWYQCLYLDAEDGADGRLFACQILGLDLRGVALVTLSACESALGRYDLNDNLRGLPAAFLTAGASTVIGVLWPVTAPVATLFYEELYRCLLAGDAKRDAFRRAQQATRAAHPEYRNWGAFTLIGDWR